MVWGEKGKMVRGLEELEERAVREREVEPT
jgi:hypothetical protein